MANRIYHWKHGWIPLDHAAALSKAHGSQAGAHKYLAAVSQKDLPRSGHVMAGFAPNGRFAIHDKKTGHSVGMSQSEAHSLVASGRRITGVKDGKVMTSADSAWTPATFEHDGTAAGQSAAAKVKQSFALGKAKVHIETSMTPEQTKALLGDISEVLTKSGHSGDVTFHVPIGDRKFGSKTSITGGYVHQGTTVVRLNPRVADGSLEHPDVNAQLAKQLMPGAEAVGFRKWTIAHELGHVVDHSHTHVMPHVHDHNGRLITSRVSEDAKTLHKDSRGGLSKYGKTNPTEAYAEVFAEFTLGKRTPLVMSYAKRYGWT